MSLKSFTADSTTVQAEWQRSFNDRSLTIPRPFREWPGVSVPVAVPALSRLWAGPGQNRAGLGTLTETLIARRVARQNGWQIAKANLPIQSQLLAY
jgi:hypothetical protein